MLHSSNNNNVIRHLHENCFRLIYHDKTSSYEELLLKDGLVSIHQENIQTLVIEMCKVKNDIVPEIASYIFCLQKQSHYNF